MTPQDILAQLAFSYMGTIDKPTIDTFRRATFGRAVGQSWCLDFVQFCVQRVVTEHPEVRVCLPLTELTSNLWDHSSAASKSCEPRRGWVAVWNRTGTIFGHCGIVLDSVTPAGDFHTIEGNTIPSPGTTISAVDGVWPKTRSLSAISRQTPGSLALCGFVNPFV